MNAFHLQDISQMIIRDVGVDGYGLCSLGDSSSRIFLGHHAQAHNVRKAYPPRFHLPSQALDLQLKEILLLILFPQPLDHFKPGVCLSVTNLTAFLYSTFI
jgi:hypothetical protein